jgi:hypothetical protein
MVKLRVILHFGGGRVTVFWVLAACSLVFTDVSEEPALSVFKAEDHNLNSHALET